MAWLVSFFCRVFAHHSAGKTWVTTYEHSDNVGADPDVLYPRRTLVCTRCQDVIESAIYDLPEDA